LGGLDKNEGLPRKEKRWGARMGGVGRGKAPNVAIFVDRAHFSKATGKRPGYEIGGKNASGKGGEKSCKVGLSADPHKKCCGKVRKRHE